MSAFLTSGHREYIQFAWQNEIAQLGDFNNWSGGAEVFVVPVVPSYFPFILWMSFSPQHLPRAPNQLKDFHVPAAVQSWIISLLLLPPLTSGQEEEIKCTPVTSKTALAPKERKESFHEEAESSSQVVFWDNWPGHCVHPVLIGSRAAGALRHVLPACHRCHRVQF